MIARKLLTLPLTAFLLCAATPVPGDPVIAERLKGHVEFLASDALEGREAGTRGHDVAAAYVAAEFRKLGLEPAGDGDGWFQRVPLRRAVHDGAPVVALERAGKVQALVPGKDAGLRPSLTHKDRTLQARLVFAGHGIRDPRLGIDDYAGLDVRGAIVVLLDGTPPGVPSDVAADLGSRKDDIAAELGAVGVLEIPSEIDRPGPFGPVERMHRARTGWVDSAGKAGSAQSVGVELAVSEAQAKALFEGSRRSLKEVRRAGTRGRVAGFILPGTLKIESKSRWEQLSTSNVVGRISGTDPARSGESIVLMAHLDHVGIDTDAAPGADRIRNGALDNAIGVATMIEAARRFVEAEGGPRRSILFIATTAEEKGLLGADYFARHPTPRAGRMTGLVNLDMPLLLYDFSDVIAFGAEHSTMRKTVEAAAASMNIALSSDPMPEQSLFTRSDHYPFVRAGVPSVFLMTGHAGDGKAKWSEFLGGNYHNVGDDLSQPIAWRAGARFAELNYRIARTLANAAEAPHWLAESYFAPPARAAGRP